MVEYSLETYHRNVSDEELINDVKRIAALLNKNALTITDYMKHGEFHFSTLHRRFHSWGEVMKKAGLHSARSLPNPRISDDVLINDVKRVSLLLNQNAVTKDDYNRYGKFNASTLQRRFQSWGNILEKAGLQQSINYHPTMTDTELIMDVKQVALLLKKNRVTIDDYNRHGKFNAATLQNRFQSWTKVMKEAGLQVSISPLKIPDEALFENIQEIWAKLGRQPRYAEIRQPLSRFGVKRYEKAFGSWRNALKKFAEIANSDDTMAPIQIEYFNRNVPDKCLIDDMLRVARQLGKVTITTEEYNEYGVYCSATISQRFQSWFNALKRAGLQPSRAPINIPDDELFKNLQEIWMKLGRQPRLREMHSPLSRFSGSTYTKRFGTWQNAMKRFVMIANAEESENITAEMPNSEKLYVQVTQNKDVETKPEQRKQRQQKRTPRQPNWRQKHLVMKRDNFRCKHCGRSPATDPSIILHIDHVKAWDRGGETTLDNLQTLCSKCNIGKSNLD